MAPEPAPSPKRKSLISFIVLMSWVPIALVLTYIPAFPWSELLWALPALPILGGIFIALRINCPHCGARLSASFPYMCGGAVVLWAVNEQCPKCGRALD